MYHEEIWYVKGKVYESEMDNCITDETGSIDHFWMDLDECFIPYVYRKNKRKRNETSKN